MNQNGRWLAVQDTTCKLYNSHLHVGLALYPFQQGELFMEQQKYTHSQEIKRVNSIKEGGEIEQFKGKIEKSK